MAAEGIEEAKKDGAFMSIDDMKIRSKIGKSVETTGTSGDGQLGTVPNCSKSTIRDGP